MLTSIVDRAPKKAGRPSAASHYAESSSSGGTPAPSTLIDRASFADNPRPFKSLAFQKKKDARNVRAKNIKQLLQIERDRAPRRILPNGEKGEMLGYMTLHPPPSLLPPKKYCDITGLPAPYRDPKTSLQYHSKEIFGVLKTLPPGAEQQYLKVRGKSIAIV